MGRNIPLVKTQCCWQRMGRFLSAVIVQLRWIGVGALHQGKQGQQTSPSMARGNPVQPSKLLSQAYEGT